MPKPIPDRWIPYKPCGRVIDGTRFICFKVPLRTRVQQNNGIKEMWDIDTLLNTIPKLGAVIDLTNTNRYYQPEGLLAAGILHRKILMPGRILPPEDVVQKFMDAVDEFLGKNCDLLVGVHCTHGLNRTGYMVCRYMRDRLNIPAPDAIKKFEKARGHQIERENYVADLLGKKPPPPDLSFGHHKKHLHGENSGSWKNTERRGSNSVRTEVTSWRDECASKSYKNTYSDSGNDGSSRSRRSDSDRSFDYTFDY